MQFFFAFCSSNRYAKPIFLFRKPLVYSQVLLAFWNRTAYSKSARIQPTALLTRNIVGRGPFPPKPKPPPTEHPPTYQYRLILTGGYHPPAFSTEIPKDTLCPLILVTLGFRLRPPTPQGVILSLSNFWGTQKREAKPSGISVGYAQDDMVEKRANEMPMRQGISYPPANLIVLIISLFPCHPQNSCNFWRFGV